MLTTVALILLHRLAAADAVAFPYLRLLDNLQEPVNLGFCIDLKGWPGQFTDAQLHSCKPTDGPAGGDSDQQFVPRNGAIVGRADAAGYCLQARSAVAGSRVDVPKCDATEAKQRFDWSEGQLRLHKTSLCLVASASLRQASCGGTCGNFKARNLRIETCASTPKMLKTWSVVTKASEMKPTVNSKPPQSSGPGGSGSQSNGHGGSGSRGSRWTETRRECYDGVDNDHDGKTDCEDSDCLADPRIKQHCEMMHGGSSNKGKSCKDDAHGTLANIGSSCAAAIQAIHGNCNADVSVGGLFPKGTLAHHVCPKTCSTCSGGGGH